MFKQTLGYGKSPVKDQSLMIITPDGIKVAFGLAADVLVYAEYAKGYFKNLEVSNSTELIADFNKLNANTTEDERMEFVAKYADDPRLLVATLSFVKERLGYGFKGEEVTISIDKTKVYADGTDNVDETRQAITKELLEAKAPYTVTMTDIGLNMTPSAEMANQSLFNLQALISTESFADLPTYDTVIFETDGKSITLHLGDQLGSRKRPVPIKQYALNSVPQATPVGTPLRAKFNMKILQQLLSLFDGDLWLSINGGAIVLSQKQPDYALTYVIAAYEGEQ